MFVQHKQLNTDNFRQVYIYTDINSTPGSKTTKPLPRACKYILSPCNKTLFNVVFDQSISGIFWAVKSADIN